MIEIVKTGHTTHKVLLKNENNEIIADLSNYIRDIDINISPFEIRNITFTVLSTKVEYKEEGA